MTMDNSTSPQLDPLQPAVDQPAVGEPVVARAPKPKSRASSALNVVLGLALVVAIAGVAFAAGRGTAPAAAVTGPTGFGQGGNFPGANGGNAGNGPGGFGGASGLEITGKVTAVGPDSVTITTSTGASITVSTTGTTTYHQQATGSATDVAAGKTVIVSVAGLGGRGQGGGAAASPGAASPRTGLTTTATDITVVP
jgi:hypothetical protein